MKTITTIEKLITVDKAVICCNQCGDLICDDMTLDPPAYFSVSKHWGYGSNKDGIRHSFDLCENCYDIFVGNFKLSCVVYSDDF